MEMFVYLKVGLSFVLVFVGAKMMLVDIYKVPIGASLGVIGGVLGLSILASWAFPPKGKHLPLSPNPQDAPHCDVVQPDGAGERPVQKSVPASDRDHL
jgi:tellurite resistance protein TerC